MGLEEDFQNKTLKRNFTFSKYILISYSIEEEFCSSISLNFTTKNFEVSLVEINQVFLGKLANVKSNYDNRQILKDNSY